MSKTNGTNDYANWDLTSYFPEFDGEAYRVHRDALEAGLAALGEDATALGTISTENAPAWAALLVREEDLMKDYSHIASYVGCLSSDYAQNEGYKREQARMARIGAMYQKAMVPVVAAMRTVEDEAFEALTACESLSGARYSLERAREDAHRSMAPELEMLSADLGVDGISAWGRLYNDVAGNLDFEMRWPDGRTERVPMAQKRTLLDDPDAEVRAAAMAGSNRTWSGVENVAGACLNGISGTRLTLNRNRGVKSFLEIAMFQSGVSQETIELMWSVVARNREVAWRYLRRKAQLIGKPKLGMQDLMCPLPLATSRRFTWAEGTGRVLDAFGASYPALGEFAQMMLDERRVESEKRAGKRPGAFCTSSYKSCESRVFMTYGGSIGDVQTLAHELGHAFHNWVMRDIRPFARSYPMTLAEAASTYAEEILSRSIIDDPQADDALKAELLNTNVGSAAIYMLDIHMRYIFEKALYTERADGELSVSRMKELMLEAQHESFGDTLAEDEMDPLFWASKLHFYITSVTFYNFPYTFGYMLSQGIAARGRAEGPEFLARYEAFLRMTGSDTAENVAQRTLGIDLTSEGFWQETIDGIAETMNQFEAIVPRVTSSKEA